METKKEAVKVNICRCGHDIQDHIWNKKCRHFTKPDSITPDYCKCNKFQKKI